MNEVNYFLGKFYDEKFLFTDENPKNYPIKGDFIFFNNTVYKVMYLMIDYDNDKFNVFVRETIEEDF